MDFLDINLNDISTDINNENVQLYVRRYLEPVHYKTLVGHFCRSYNGLTQRASAMTSLNTVLVASINEGKIIHCNNHFYADTHAEDMQRYIDLQNNSPRDDVTTEVIQVNKSDESEVKEEGRSDGDVKKEVNESENGDAKKVESVVRTNDVDGDGALDEDSKGEGKAALKDGEGEGALSKVANATKSSDSVEEIVAADDQ